MPFDSPLAAKPRTEIVRRELAPALRQAARVLWSRYESLDIQVHTTLGTLEQDLLAAMPIVEGHENEIRQMVAMHANDIQSEFRSQFGAASKPFLVRFVNQDHEDNIAQVVPENASRVVVTPVAEDESLHATLENEIATQAVDDEMHGMRERFVTVAMASAVAQKQNAEDEYLKSRDVMSKAEVRKLQQITRMLNQAMADAGQSMEGQTALVGLLGAVKQMAQSVTTYAANVARKAERSEIENAALVRDSMAIRQNVVAVEKQLSSQIGNMGLSDTLRMTMRSGLQQIQQARVEAMPQLAQTNVSRIIARAEPLMVVAPVVPQAASIKAAVAATVGAPREVERPVFAERAPIARQENMVTNTVSVTNSVAAPVSIAPINVAPVQAASVQASVVSTIITQAPTAQAAAVTITAPTAVVTPVTMAPIAANTQPTVAQLVIAQPTAITQPAVPQSATVQPAVVQAQPTIIQPIIVQSNVVQPVAPQQVNAQPIVVPPTVAPTTTAVQPQAPQQQTPTTQTQTASPVTQVAQQVEQRTERRVEPAQPEVTRSRSESSYQSDDRSEQIARFASSRESEPEARVESRKGSSVSYEDSSPSSIVAKKAATTAEQDAKKNPVWEAKNDNKTLRDFMVSAETTAKGADGAKSANGTEIKKDFKAAAEEGCAGCKTKACATCPLAGGKLSVRNDNVAAGLKAKFG